MNRLSRSSSREPGIPRREDHGDLIVLHLYGSYREMGRQHVELLGPLAREVYDLQHRDWMGLAAELGLAERAAQGEIRLCTPPRATHQVSDPSLDGA